MIVEQVNTEVLINLIVKHYIDIRTSCCIFSESDHNINLTKYFFMNQRSFRANLKSGKYHVQVKMIDNDEIRGSELSNKYFKIGEIEFKFCCSILLPVRLKKHMEKFVFI